jgi:hypothetical protein
MPEPQPQQPIYGRFVEVVVTPLHEEVSGFVESGDVAEQRSLLRLVCRTAGDRV